MLKSIAFADVDQELAGTRRVLERIPDERLAWKPHEKSWSLGELATHVVNLLGWQMGILTSDVYDFAETPPPRGSLPSRDAMLEEFDARAEALGAELGRQDDEGLSADWTLRNGDDVLFSAPRAVALRSFGMSHLAHHRGQLSLYLRLLDVPVPGLYGPSADEQG